MKITYVEPIPQRRLTWKSLYFKIQIVNHGYIYKTTYHKSSNQRRNHIYRAVATGGFVALTSCQNTVQLYGNAPNIPRHSACKLTNTP